MAERMSALLLALNVSADIEYFHNTHYNSYTMFLLEQLKQKLDIALFSIFLLANLVVGLSYGWKVKTLRDYAIGNRNFSTAALTATIIATWLGGGYLFYTLENTYIHGIYYIIATTGASLGLLFTGQVLSVRMGEFLGKLTIAEAMGSLYGNTIKRITALSGILTATGELAIQFQVIAKILAMLFGVQVNSVIATAALIVIIYSAFGGIRAVTFTDVLQFITFGTFIPILALVVYNGLNKPEQVIHTLSTNPIFNLKTMFGWNPSFTTALGVMLYLTIPGMNAPISQRIAMAQNTSQVKHAFSLAALAYLLIAISVSWVGVLLLTQDATLDPQNLVDYLIDHYTYPGLKGLIGIGIVAMAMSTADSHLNSSAILLVHDLLGLRDMTERYRMIAARVLAVSIGVFALLLALRIDNLLQLLLAAGSFYMPIYTVPFLMAIFGFRSSTRAVLIGMAFGVCTVVIWRMLAFGMDAIAPGMLANLAGLLGSHSLLREKGGWVGIKNKVPLLAARQKRALAWQRFKEQLRDFSLPTYLQHNLPQKEYTFSLLGLYIIAATYASFYTVAESARASYGELYSIIYHSVLITTTGLLTYPVWPPTLKSKHFISWVWPLSIFYILFVAGFWLVIMSGFHELQVMIFLLNLVMATLLLSWPLALGSAAVGIITAVQVFRLYTGEHTLPGDLGSLQFRLFYGLLLFSSFLLTLFHHKQAKKYLEHKHEHLITNYEATSTELVKALHYEERLVKALNTEGIEEFANLAKLSEQLAGQVKALDVTLPSPIVQTLDKIQGRLAPAAHYLQALTHRTTSYLRLAVDTIATDKLLHEVLAILPLQESPIIPSVILHNYAKTQPVQCDVVQVKKLLVNALLYAQSQYEELQHFLLTAETTMLGYPINSVNAHIKKVRALRFVITPATSQELPPNQDLYWSSVGQLNVYIPHSKQDLPYTKNQRIVAAHYGYASLEKLTDATAQIYVIPLQLREVRPKDIDIPEMEVDGPPHAVADESYPGAAEQEEKLLATIQSKTKADLAVIKKALKLIKYYHGPAKRKSGEPFYLHPLAVAQIVLNYTKDEDTILGALLHDTVEDTELPLSQIGFLFNASVQRIVDGVTNLDSNLQTLHKVKLTPWENIQQLLAAVDQRSWYIKIADRVHNMRTIQGHRSIAKQKSIAMETLQFFVPRAKELGLLQAAKELEERCIAVSQQTA